MVKPAYSHEERVQLFMDSFHFFANLEDWPWARKLMRPDEISEATFKINDKTGLVQLKRSPLKYRDASYIGSHFRKFISKLEPTYLPQVVESVRAIGITGHTVDEVDSQARQTITPRFEFIVDPESNDSVGMRLAELPGPVRWRPETDIDSPYWKRIHLSTRDATEVFFNEGGLHPFEPIRREEARAPIRSAPEVYQTFLAHIAIASTVYAVGSLHMALNDSGDPRWKCASFCQERVILERLRKSHTE